MKRIFSQHGEHLTLYCSNHKHEWDYGYIDVDDKTAKHILDTFLLTGNVGLEPVSLNFHMWPDTGKPPELDQSPTLKEALEENK